MDTAINGCVEMSKEIIQDKIQDRLIMSLDEPFDIYLLV